MPPVFRPLIVLAVAAGLLAGVGLYTYVYARGGSYLTNDPAACANCHIMSEQYAGWIKSSHHTVAVCNDCHTPHNVVGKYTTKALNGFWHSVAFTSGRFHEPIQITSRNQRVTEGACRACHSEIVHAIEAPTGGDDVSCIRCHRVVGHGP